MARKTPVRRGPSRRKWVRGRWRLLADGPAIDTKAAAAVANPYGVDAAFAPAILPASGAPDERLMKQK